MIDMIVALISNVAIATLIASVALLLSRWWRCRTLVHALWIIVLIKLITPPLIALPWVSMDRLVSYIANGVSVSHQPLTGAEHNSIDLERW